MPEDMRNYLRELPSVPLQRSRTCGASLAKLLLLRCGIPHRRGPPQKIRGFRRGNSPGAFSAGSSWEARPGAEGAAEGTAEAAPHSHAQSTKYGAAISLVSARLFSAKALNSLVPVILNCTKDTSNPPTMKRRRSETALKK